MASLAAARSRIAARGSAARIERGGSKKTKKPRNGKVPASQRAVNGKSLGEDLLSAEQMRQRIGQLTRTLHNALRELGYDKDLAQVRQRLPDARDRLSYIARVTGEAAEKVLNGVDRARIVQEGLTTRADGLHKRWRTVAQFAQQTEKTATLAGRDLIEDTCAFCASVSGQADVTNAILTDIMMAQDFHDLTGQTIRKIAALGSELETQLVRLLIDTTPTVQRAQAELKAEPDKNGHELEGPVVNPNGRNDIVTDQAGVDELLASLGF